MVNAEIMARRNLSARSWTCQETPGTVYWHDYMEKPAGNMLPLNEIIYDFFDAWNGIQRICISDYISGRL